MQNKLEQTTELTARGKPRKTIRSAKYDAIREQLEDVGYKTWRLFQTRYALYRMLIVAINHLATVLKRDPYRVMQAVYWRAYKSQQGKRFTPANQAQLDPEGYREEEERGGLHVICPVCGTDLINTETVTEQEFLIQRRRKFPQKSPQSTANEGR